MNITKELIAKDLLSIQAVFLKPDVEVIGDLSYSLNHIAMRN